MGAIESLFHHHGYKCVVVFTQNGHRCGYVAVPMDHPAYGVHYHDYNWNDDTDPIHQLLEAIHVVHGGITYSEKAEHATYPTNQFDPVWWFGFDCAHAWDCVDIQTAERLLTPKQAAYVRTRMEWFYTHDGEIRSLEYVQDECRKLAENLKKLED